MNRRDWICNVALGSAGLLASRYLKAQGSELKLEPLSDGFHLLTGAGGNITILDTKDGLLITDSGLPNTADAVVTKIKSVSAAPLKILIDTHWHSDHVGGNTAVAATGAEIVAHVNTLKRVSTTQHMAFMKRDVEPLPAQGLPKKTFSGEKKMTFGSETLEVVHHPAAHTDGDTTVFFPKSNIFVCGDLLFNGFYPFIDYSSGGYIEGMIHDAEQILKTVDASTKIVPGHGPLASKADVQKFHDMLAGVNEAVSSQIKQGKSLAEVVAAAPTQKFDAEWGNGFLKPDQVVTMLYQGKTDKSLKAA